MAETPEDTTAAGSETLEAANKQVYSADEHVIGEKRPRDESDDENQESVVMNFKRPRFEVFGEDQINDYELPLEMADYCNKYMGKFVPEKDVKESVLKDNPVPMNLLKPRKLDDFFHDSMEQKHRKPELLIDESLQKIEQKITNIYGPLCRAWYALEATLNRPEDNISLEQLSNSIQQTVLMVGQAVNSVTYHRRLNVLSTIQDKKKAKTTLREQSNLFEDIKEPKLFGAKFQQNVVDLAKVKKKSKEVFDNMDKRKQQQSRSSGNRGGYNRQPFRRGPPSSQGRNGGQSRPPYNNRNNFPRIGGNRYGKN